MVSEELCLSRHVRRTWLSTPLFVYTACFFPSSEDAEKRKKKHDDDDNREAEDGHMMARTSAEGTGDSSPSSSEHCDNDSSFSAAQNDTTTTDNNNNNNNSSSALAVVGKPAGKLPRAAFSSSEHRQEGVIISSAEDTRSVSSSGYATTAIPSTQFSSQSFRSPLRPSGRRLTFPEKLMDLLNREESRDGLSWFPGGKSFAIHRVPFLKKILPKHFESTKFESFTRKLNRWGFKRIANEDTPEDSFAYSHRFFQRDCPQLCRGMSGGKKLEQDLSHLIRPAEAPISAAQSSSEPLSASTKGPPYTNEPRGDGPSTMAARQDSLLPQDRGIAYCIPTVLGGFLPAHHPLETTVALRSSALLQDPSAHVPAAVHTYHPIHDIEAVNSGLLLEPCVVPAPSLTTVPILHLPATHSVVASGRPSPKAHLSVSGLENELLLREVRRQDCAAALAARSIVAGPASHLGGGGLMRGSALVESPAVASLKRLALLQLPLADHGRFTLL